MSPFISYQQNGIILWDQIQLAWLKLSALLVVFIVNFYLLIPLLLYKKHYLRYTITLFALLPLVICLEQKIVEQLNQQPAITMPSMSKGSPIEFSNEMPPPEGYRVKQAN